MSVKPSRQVERAAATRRRIAAAARGLFASQGYTATTLAQVAEAAGVAVQTVYAVYGSKAGILRALREGLASHAEADALYERAVAEADPGRKAALMAESLRRRWEDGHDIVAIHEDAGRSDPSIRQETDQLLERRRRAFARLTRDQRAVALVDALTLPQVYETLVSHHGWTPAAYEAWLAQALEQVLSGRHPA
ncbi:MAG TPA: TetR family transcriptional regulator [Candidatus Dormibacteraeota bacterium]